MLAKWFGFQPSEIDALDYQDFAQWCTMAMKQIKAQQDALPN